jgi:hypothetical protein
LYSLGFLEVFSDSDDIFGGGPHAKSEGIEGEEVPFDVIMEAEVVGRSVVILMSSWHVDEDVFPGRGKCDEVEAGDC